MSEGRSLPSFIRSEISSLTERNSSMGLDHVKIHESAYVSGDAIIGANSSIWNNSQVREGVHIGHDCILGKDVYIDFDVEIGDNVKIQNGALVYHGTIIESGVFVGPGVIFTNDKKPRSINTDGSLKSNDDWVVGKILVRYGASIGAGAIIVTGVTIGRFALVGAGAVVTRDVPDHALVVGNPAQQIGYVCGCGERLIDNGSGTWICQACDETFLIPSN
jgi:acetyltransferase-like isoleucine patch superfamily enzyme